MFFVVVGTSGLADMSLGTASSNGSDISLGSMESTPGGMPGGSFPFANMGPTDMSGMGMGLSTSMGMDGTFTSNDPHNQNGMGGIPMGPHDTDVNSHRESLGSLGQLPRNFSLSDLTAELTNSAGQYYWIHLWLDSGLNRWKSVNMLQIYTNIKIHLYITFFCSIYIYMQS